MLDGTETVERSTRRRFGGVFRSRSSVATSPTMAAASSRSIPGPRGRTRMALGPRRISAGVLKSSFQIKGLLEAVNSSVVFWFEYCMLEASNTSSGMASGASILGKIPCRLLGRFGS